MPIPKPTAVGFNIHFHPSECMADSIGRTATRSPHPYSTRHPRGNFKPAFFFFRKCCRVSKNCMSDATESMKNYFSQIESTLPFFRQGELSNHESNLFRKTIADRAHFFEIPSRDPSHDVETQRLDAACRCRAVGGREQTLCPLDCRWTKLLSAVDLCESDFHVGSIECRSQWLARRRSNASSVGLAERSLAMDPEC